jgi:hypothetical protein
MSAGNKLLAHTGILASKGPVIAKSQLMDFKELFVQTPTGMRLTPAQPNDNLISKIEVHPRNFFYQAEGKVYQSRTCLLEGTIDFPTSEINMGFMGQLLVFILMLQRSLP